MRFSISAMPASCLVLFAPPALADPTLECSAGLGSQVEIGTCVSDTETRVDQSVQIALEFAQAAAKDLDDVTERTVSLPALNAGQSAWEAYRDQHCEFVGTTFGGGSGTGIAISACRVDLGRDRVSVLMRYTQ